MDACFTFKKGAASPNDYVTAPRAKKTEPPKHQQDEKHEDVYEPLVPDREVDASTGGKTTGAAADIVSGGQGANNKNNDDSDQDDSGDFNM